MIKKLVLSLLLLSLCVITSVNAKTIVWITEVQDQDNDGTNDSKVWADKLTAAGYTVDFQPGHWNTLTAALVTNLNAADLVIVSCTTQSSNFASATLTPLWNGVTAPMMLCSPYIARSTRWQWINNGDGTLPNNNGDQGSPLLQAVKTDHPIFYGISLDSNNQVKAVDPNLGSGNCSFLATNNAGNGTLIAKTVPTSLVQDWCWIVEWKKGVTFYNGSSYTAPNLRMYFTGIGDHEVSGTYPMRGYNLTDQGWKLFLNAVKYMLGEPLLPPTMASNPYPLDGQTEVSPSIVTHWTPGISAQTHDVYLGTGLADVNSASRSKPLGVLVKQDNDVNSFDPPGNLAYGTTYYWRIDEVGAGMKGVVWSFTTELLYYPVTDITATASSFSPGADPNQTINGSGIDASDLASSTNTTMWLTAKGTTLPAWIQYNLGRVRKVESMVVWNYNAQFEDIIGIGARGVTIEYSTDAVSWTQLSGVPEFAQGPGAEGYAANTTVNFGGVAARYVKLTITSTWGGKQTGLSEVRFLEMIDFARSPQPASGATGVSPSTTLSWRSGREAASASVYVGTDPNVLTLSGTTTTNSFAPTGLLLGTQYYWRVDEVNVATTPSTWASDVWNFTTPDFLMVDDMESYTADEATGKAIYQTWVDGYGTTTNGSVIGYGTSANGTFGETTIVHGGRQSMPFAYGSNNITTSEATRTFDTAQDWTLGGVKTLVIFFEGVATNSPVQLYVKINGTNVNYSGISAGLAAPLWKQWNIDLASVSGVNFKAVKTLTLGVTGSGKGTLYFDDIRLYKTAPAVVTPVDPGTSGLVAYYPLENDAKDSIGGTSGTLNNITFAASTAGFGQAAQFNGTTGYIDLGASVGNLMSTLNSATFAVWVNYTGTTTAWQRAFDFGNAGVNGGNPQTYLFMSPLGSTNPRFAYTIASNGSEVGVTASSALKVGWHHLAGVIDASTMRVALYVDGTAQGNGVTTTILPKDLGKTTQNFLGRSQWTADPYLTGSIDELRIFNRALSAGEIRYLAGDR